MNENDTVVLINGLPSGSVQNIQRRLETYSIPSVHISSGNKIPRPVGVRVKLKDYERSVNILKSMGFKPHTYSESDKKRAKRHVVVIFALGGVAMVFLLLVILGILK